MDSSHSDTALPDINLLNDAIERMASAYSALNPPPTDCTRLWRVGVAPEYASSSIPGWIRAQREVNGHKDSADRWFAKDPNILGFYGQDYWPKGELACIDVEHPENFKVANIIPHPNKHGATIDPRHHSKDHENEYFVPRFMANSVTRVGSVKDFMEGRLRFSPSCPHPSSSQSHEQRPSSP